MIFKNLLFYFYVFIILLKADPSIAKDVHGSQLTCITKALYLYVSPITDKNIKQAYRRSYSGQGAQHSYQKHYGQFLDILGITNPTKEIPDVDTLSARAISHIVNQTDLLGASKAALYEKLVNFITAFHLSYLLGASEWSNGKIIFAPTLKKNILIIYEDGSVWSGKSSFKDWPGDESAKNSNDWDLIELDYQDGEKFLKKKYLLKRLKPQLPLSD